MEKIYGILIGNNSKITNAKFKVLKYNLYLGSMENKIKWNSNVS